MSDFQELTMAEKRALLREASPKGLGNVESELANRRSPLAEPKPDPWPYSSNTSVQQASSTPPTSPQSDNIPELGDIVLETTAFRLKTAVDQGTAYWKVLLDNSSITDGTNGPSIDLSAAGFDTAVVLTETSFIVLEATVAADRSVTEWTLLAVTDEAETAEVRLTDGLQDRVRLLIGKATIENGGVRVSQTETRPQILSEGFINGTICSLLSPFRLHPSNT